MPPGFVSVHLSIFYQLSGLETCSDLLLLHHCLQLFQDCTEAFPTQLGDFIFSSLFGGLGPTSSQLYMHETQEARGDFPITCPNSYSWRLLNVMEQELYVEILQNERASHSVLKCSPETPQRAYFCSLPFSAMHHLY